MNLQFLMSPASMQVVIHEIICLAVQRGCNLKNPDSSLQAVFVEFLVFSCVVVIMLLLLDLY